MAGAALLLVLLVLVRVVCLDSDAYARLSWSSALLTDEGFYVHNARNLVLFHRLRTDQFNNALIMPLLHGLQVAVFTCFGVGVVQARSVSVVSSLLTLFVFFCALRRAFSPRVAWAGLLLLGLDPVFMLYNRLALMDTPACLPLVCAFYAWVRAEKSENKRGHWLVVCGACLGLAYTVRGLAAVVLPVPFLLLLGPVLRRGRVPGIANPRQESASVVGTRYSGKPYAAVYVTFLQTGQQALASAGRLFCPAGDLQSPDFPPLFAYLAGLALVLGIYLFAWYLPHHEEIARVNAYYLHHQLVPRNGHVLLANIQTALVSRYRGAIPFLLKHSPVLFLLGGAGGLLMRKRPHRQAERQSSVYYLAGWFWILLVFVCIVDYAPSRYYVLFYPAMAGLAAVSLDFMLCHAALEGIQLRTWGMALLVTAWLGLNAYWYADWIVHLTYRQRAADHWLAAHLPANTVLIGAVAPGLCMNSRFRCVPVIQDLCNDDTPLERFADAPRCLLIIDRDANQRGALVSAAQRARADRWKERWWMQHYPGLVKPENRMYAFPSLLRPFFTIGVYPVPQDAATPSFRKTRGRKPFNL